MQPSLPACCCNPVINDVTQPRYGTDTSYARSWHLSARHEVELEADPDYWAGVSRVCNSAQPRSDCHQEIHTRQFWVGEPKAHVVRNHWVKPTANHKQRASRRLRLRIGGVEKVKKSNRGAWRKIKWVQREN